MHLNATLEYLCKLKFFPLLVYIKMLCSLGVGKSFIPTSKLHNIFCQTQRYRLIKGKIWVYKGIQG